MVECLTNYGVPTTWMCYNHLEEGTDLGQLRPLLRENNKKEIHSGEKAVGCISDTTQTQKPGCWDSKPLFYHSYGNPG